ncbi:hypothetical protein HK096_011604, partial [Nowakowskiella sp. JEL0078]
IPWFYPKFLATSFANVGLSLLKDLYFTRAFGAKSVMNTRAVPSASYLLYTTRDSMTIFASFNLPGIMAPHIQSSFGLSENTSMITSQLIAPLSVQFISSPLHLLGMDLYNRPAIDGAGMTWKRRADFIKKEYLLTTAGRLGRILPAYSIGGVLNNSIRNRGKKFLEIAKDSLSDGKFIVCN